MIHNNLEEYVYKKNEGLPDTGSRKFKTIKIRWNTQGTATLQAENRKTTISIDLGVFPLGTAVNIKGHVIVFGYGLSGEIAKCNKQIAAPSLLLV